MRKIFSMAATTAVTLLIWHFAAPTVRRYPTLTGR